MKIVGILRVKDEADLLPKVLENVSDGVDEIYAYDDNSSDSTLTILKRHPKVTYIKTYDPTFDKEIKKTRHLESVVKKRHPDFRKEQIWVALLAGDLWWETHTPRRAAAQAIKLGCDLRTGVVIDFNRWKWDEKSDQWPNWRQPIQELCTWCSIIEELPVVWKVADYTTWNRLPWPGNFKNRWTGIAEDSAFLLHYGKRSPRYHQWKYLNGRELPTINGTKSTLKDWESLEFAYKHGKSLGYWENPNRIPWKGPETISLLLALEKMSYADRKDFYASLKHLRTP